MRKTEKCRKLQFKEKIRGLKNNGFWVIAGLLMIYAFWQVGSVIVEITNYYGTSEDKATLGEYITYSVQAGLQPLLWAIAMIGFGSVTKRLKDIQEKLSEQAETLKKIEAKKSTRKKKNSTKGTDA